jgi:CubicO group peptidase (beta-lactamase class C family)
VEEMMFGFFFYTADGENLNLTIDPKTGYRVKDPPAPAAKERTEAKTTAPAKLDAAFELVKSAVDKGTVPGAIALVTQHGKVIREEAYGLADVENKVSFKPDTLCWIASITKPVTVAAAMKLIEEGKLGLDDPVEKYLPEFAELKDKDGKHHAVTIRQLMSHTSGIQANPPLRPSFFFAQEFLGKKISDIAPAIAETQLQFEPGSKTQYSNAAPYVLARVIEVRSGKPFHEHVRETILEPAGMRDSYFIIPASEGKRAAVVYRDTKVDGKEERVDFFRFDPNWKVTMTLPDGGLFSSPREIAKFLQAFLDDDGRVLAKSSVKAMRQQQTPGWGLGWALEENGALHHSGSSGVTAWADPQTGVVGVLFCQLQNPAKVDPLQARFRELVREAFR